MLIPLYIPDMDFEELEELGVHNSNDYEWLAEEFLLNEIDSYYSYLNYPEEKQEY